MNTDNENIYVSSFILNNSKDTANGFICDGSYVIMKHNLKKLLYLKWLRNHTTESPMCKYGNKDT